MITQQRKHDTVTNNIANINTPGYKQSYAVARSFPEMLIERIRGGEDGPQVAQLGNLNTGVFAEENIAVHVQGDLQETNNPYDFALVSNIDVPGATFDASGKYVNANGERIFEPQALFTLQNANGERRYSLNGKFTVEAQGQLVNSDGLQVLGADGQPIVLTDQNGEPIRNIKVTSNGQILDTNGQPVNNGSSLSISRIDDPNKLILEGNGLYRVNPGDEALINPINATDRVEVKQGFIERSNVDATQSMVDMMSALRAYEANQKIIQFYDRSLDKAVNEVGRV
jgi:flagellar basal-body rod protein FlgF